MPEAYQTGPRNLITDVAGLRVGQAEEARVKTGVSVLVGDAPFTAGVHVMGGAPGTRETDLLAPDKLVQEVDAIVLSGGSAFGLEACGGVMEGLRAMGRGFEAAGHLVPIVPGAILFDLANGGAVDWPEGLYRQLGAEAFVAASADVALGSAGAGMGCTTAGVKGGIGSASFVLASGHTVGALVAVNAVGAPLVEEGPHFWAGAFEVGDEFGGHGPAPSAPAPGPARTKLSGHVSGPGEATTIGIVATDAALTQAQCTRLATAAHDGFARALVPAHSPLDGDLLFAVATGEKPLGDPLLETLELGHAAAICVARAIARGVYEASVAEGDPFPAYGAL